MSRAPRTPPENPARTAATELQSIASDPAHSAWVAANAGSGKTHVLARRVIRLLLNGTAPARILCLTYTKAAAANMANRVLSILAQWVALPDTELDAALAATASLAPTPKLRARARRLFATALETPGGLKVETIHAFCGGVLHRFPFEAGVAAGFRELDELGGAELMARIRSDLIVEATADPDGEIGQALALLMAEMSDFSIAALIDAAVAERRQIEALDLPQAALREVLASAIGIAPGDTVEAVEARMLESAYLPRAAWGEVAELLATSDKVTDRDRGADLAAAADADDDGEALDLYRRVWFTDKGEPRAASRLVTKSVAAANPDLYDALLAEHQRMADLDALLRGARALKRTEAALALGAEACRRYGAHKEALGLLDFDDLIAKASALLNRVPASFVHYKLDQGIDHVLVDEAQDTSPEQWEVVSGLTSDFFAGAGARGDVARTVFVVGDEKQSIFSFQGADPRAFGGMHATFAAQAGKRAFPTVKLPHSFRSAPGVLEAVDRIFAREQARAGVTLDGLAPVHAAIRADAPALVELWPTVTPTAHDEVDDWRRPLDEMPADDPVNTLARRIAGFIRAALAARLAVPSRDGRGLQAGDVMILVRRRGRIFEAAIRALKEAGVAVAGADRLVVAEHIAAMDLMALADALLSPDDDLSLASVLKSPLFGLTDDDLIALCPGRRGRLIDELVGRAGENPLWAEAARRLAAWRGDARALRPFDFYARVLGRDGGRRAMLARLGSEAADVLDEFMALARSYEQAETASLPGFLDYLRRGGAETKRDMESGRNEVRVMTVHGAKGLEAPLVILADTVDMPRPRTAGGLLSVPAGQGRAVPILAPRKPEDTPALAEAREQAAARDREEHRRLLYVALTRAEDAVVICGAETALPGKEKPHARPEGCWYELVREALEREARAVPALGFEGEVLRWSKGDGFGAGHGGAAEIAAGPMPDEAAPPFRALPPDPVRRILSPSRLGAEAPRPAPAPGPAAADTPALSPLLRGDLVHRLLAGLAELPPDRREEAGLRLLRHQAAELGAALHGDILAEALGVLGHGPLAPLFGAGSRAEVPILGELGARDGGAFEISGRIDRLCIREDLILLADFKTDRVPPAHEAEIGESYVAQLASYGVLLSQAFGGRAVETLLIYTRAPRVFRLPPQRLSAALERLGLLPC